MLAEGGGGRREGRETERGRGGGEEGGREGGKKEGGGEEIRH